MTKQLPPAHRLTWGWLPENSPNLADAYFDEDGDPFELFLAPKLRTSNTLLSHSILHEMAHMWLYPITGHGPAWRAEQLRLASLGATLL